MSEKTISGRVICVWRRGAAHASIRSRTKSPRPPGGYGPVEQSGSRCHWKLAWKLVVVRVTCASSGGRSSNAFGARATS